MSCCLVSLHFPCNRCNIQFGHALLRRLRVAAGVEKTRNSRQCGQRCEVSAVQVAKQWRDADRPCNLQAKKMEISLGLVQEDSNRSRPSSSLHSLSTYILFRRLSTLPTNLVASAFQEVIAGARAIGSTRQMDNHPIPSEMFTLQRRSTRRVFFPSSSSIPWKET